MDKVIIGIDLGGTFIKAGCFDMQLNLLSRDSIETKARKGPEQIVENIGVIKDSVLEKAGKTDQQLCAVGFGTPGPINLEKGLVVGAPNLPGFNNTPMRKMVKERLGTPCVMENDANAAAWGEFVSGAGSDSNEMIFFTLGTGIGGGVVCNGQLVHGYKDVAAELGHLIIYPDSDRLCGCGQKGCAEAYASASSTARRAQEQVEAGRKSSMKQILDAGEEITAKDVFEHAAKGDELAAEIVDTTAKTLALLSIGIYHVTGPRKIVFAGGMIAAGDQLLGPVKKYFTDLNWQFGHDVEICFAALGEDAGIIGSAGLALKAYQEDSFPED